MSDEYLIFSLEDKLVIQDTCRKYKIQVEYKIASRPYLYQRPYREYCILTCFYKGYINWEEKRYIRAGRAKLKGRKYHFVLCDANPIVSTNDGKRFFKGPPEPHKIRRFVNIAMGLIEILNDDGYRKPHSLQKIEEYKKVFAELEKIAKQRIRSRYGRIPYQQGVQLLLFGEGE